MQIFLSFTKLPITRVLVFIERVPFAILAFMKADENYSSMMIIMFAVQGNNHLRVKEAFLMAFSYFYYSCLLQGVLSSHLVRIPPVLQLVKTRFHQKK